MKPMNWHRHDGGRVRVDFLTVGREGIKHILACGGSQKDVTHEVVWVIHGQVDGNIAAKHMDIN